MTPPLPEYRPTLTDVKIDGITGEFSGVYHPVVKLPCGRVAVDVWVDADGQVWGSAWRREDHSNLKALPDNAPRKVKHLYKAAGQLAQLRSTDYMAQPYFAASKAWEEYWLARKG